MVATIQRSRAFWRGQAGYVRRGDDDPSELPAQLAMIGRRHVPLVASLREAVLDQTLQAPVEGLDDALRLASTQRYLAARRRTHEELRRRRVRAPGEQPRTIPVLRRPTRTRYLPFAVAFDGIRK